MSPAFDKPSNFANPNFSYITGKSFEGEGSDEFAKATKTTETQKQTADFANRILRQNRDLLNISNYFKHFLNT